MIKFTYNDKEYEFRGEYNDPQQGDAFLTNGGNVITLNYQPSIVWGFRAIVHPIPVYHTFNGVKWEEGERRHIKAGEVSLEENGGLHIWHFDSANPHILLIPVEIINDQDN